MGQVGRSGRVAMAPIWAACEGLTQMSRDPGNERARRARLFFGLSSLLVPLSIIGFGRGSNATLQVGGKIILLLVWSGTPLVFLTFVRSLPAAILLGSFLLGSTLWALMNTFLSSQSTAGIGLVVTPIFQFLVVGIGAHIDSSRRRN